MSVGGGEGEGEEEEGDVKKLLYICETRRKEQCKIISKGNPLSKEK